MRPVHPPGSHLLVNGRVCQRCAQGGADLVQPATGRRDADLCKVGGEVSQDPGDQGVPTCGQVTQRGEVAGGLGLPELLAEVQ